MKDPGHSWVGLVGELIVAMRLRSEKVERNYQSFIASELQGKLLETWRVKGAVRSRARMWNWI